MSTSERQRSIDKNVSGALLLAFFAYHDPDKDRGSESIRVANVVMNACGYPNVPDVTPAQPPRAVHAGA